MTTDRPSTVGEVLVVSFQGIGNALLALPAVGDIRRAHPDARVTMVVGDRRQAELFAHAESIDRTVALPGSRLSSLGLARALRAARPDVAVVTFPHGRASAWLARLSGAAVRVGHIDDGLHRTGRRLFTNPVPIDRSLHDVDQNRALAAALGAGSIGGHTARFDFPAAIVASVRQAIASLPGGAERPLLAIHPSCASKFPEKRWAPARFGTLAAILAEQRGLLPVVLFGPKEKEMAREAVSASGGAAVLGPDLGLVETAVFLAESALVVSNDSGMMNLAAVLGVPTVGVFGPSEPVRSRPLGPASAYVQAELDCCPCWKLAPPDACVYGEARCMDSIEPERVADACGRVLDAAGDGA